MLEEQHSWVTYRLSVALAAVANGSGWIISTVSENINVGAIVTACTVALPAACGGAIYVIKNLGPVLLQFLKDIDAARSQTLSGQMAELTKNLAITNRENSANKELAEILKDQADALRVSYDELKLVYKASEKRNVELGQTLAKIEARVEDLNQKLHEEKRFSNRYLLMYEELQREHDEYKSRLGPVIEQSAENRQKIDELGVKVGVAGSVLAMSPEVDAARPNEADSNSSH